MCGDEDAVKQWDDPEKGTPPRARGRGPAVPAPRWGRRNTPACAGTSGPWALADSGVVEHPRVRGDETLGMDIARAVSGNTPACAGTNLPTPASKPARWEHPRVRGDEEGNHRHGDRPQGTPPRARGRELVVCEKRTRQGNTPACAGTRRRTASAIRRWWEHPRVRGDEQVPGHRRWRDRGTPPRARGRDLPEPGERGGAGNTPACAGTSRLKSRRHVSTPEHPRVRGD